MRSSKGSGRGRSGRYDSKSSHSRHHHHRRRGSRTPRGDVRAAVLQLLAEEPMHGYQLMRAITDRTGGRWEPSPGAIYPTINQLADEGLVVVTDDAGRKLVTLTDEGRAQVESDKESRPDPFASYDTSDSDVDLRGLLGGLHSAVREVGRSGDDAQREAAAEVLTDARRRLYLLLAEDTDGTD